MALLQDRAPPADVAVDARMEGRGPDRAAAPTWPGRVKGRQPAPGAVWRPFVARRGAGSTCAGLEQWRLRASSAAYMGDQATGRRAWRALEVVEKIVTAQANFRSP